MPTVDKKTLMSTGNKNKINKDKKSCKRSLQRLFLFFSVLICWSRTNFKGAYSATHSIGVWMWLCIINTLITTIIHENINFTLSIFSQCRWFICPIYILCNPYEELRCVCVSLTNTHKHPLCLLPSHTTVYYTGSIQYDKCSKLLSLKGQNQFV